MDLREALGLDIVIEMIFHTPAYSNKTTPLSIQCANHQTRKNTASGQLQQRQNNNNPPPPTYLYAQQLILNISKRRKKKHPTTTPPETKATLPNHISLKIKHMLCFFCSPGHENDCTIRFLLLCSKNLRVLSPPGVGGLHSATAQHSTAPGSLLACWMARWIFITLLPYLMIHYSFIYSFNHLPIYLISWVFG